MTENTSVILQSKLEKNLHILIQAIDPNNA